MSAQDEHQNRRLTKTDEEEYLARTLAVVRNNLASYGEEVARMQGNIDDMRWQGGA